MTINKNPQPRELIAFGAALPAFFAVMGFIVAARSDSDFAPRAIWIAGGVVSLAYLGIAAVRRPVFIGWAYLAYPIGWLVTHALVAAVFWGVVTPIGLLVRLLGHDPLATKYDRSAGSYWTPKDKPADVGRYFQQF